MAQSRRSSRSRESTRARSRRNGAGSDAISLLKADHDEVKKWFGEFEKARSDTRKQELAEKICMALKAHTIIEEEIFYPAFLEATQEKGIHHEAEVEHEGAKKLIEEIEAAGPDDYFDARVSVLSEMIKHHVNEEEKRGGMFAKARNSEMDLESLGEQLQQRKQEVMQGEDASLSETEPGRRGRGKLAGLFGRNGRGRDARRSAT